MFLFLHYLVLHVIFKLSLSPSQIGHYRSLLLVPRLASQSLRNVCRFQSKRRPSKKFLLHCFLIIPQNLFIVRLQACQNVCNAYDTKSESDPAPEKLSRPASNKTRTDIFRILSISSSQFNSAHLRSRDARPLSSMTRSVRQINSFCIVSWLIKNIHI